MAFLSDCSGQTFHSRDKWKVKSRLPCLTPVLAAKLSAFHHEPDVSCVSHIWPASCPGWSQWFPIAWIFFSWKIGILWGAFPALMEMFCCCCCCYVNGGYYVDWLLVFTCIYLFIYLAGGRGGGRGGMCLLQHSFAVRGYLAGINFLLSCESQGS